MCNVLGSVLGGSESGPSKGLSLSQVKFLARRVVKWLVWSASGYLEGALMT